MKTVFITILILIGSFNLIAQTNGELLQNDEAPQRTEEYAMVLATSRFLSLKVSVSVDYGQERKLFKENRLVKDEDGKIQSFNSVVDPLNYMNEQGWEFVNAYSVTVGNQNVYHYLMRRKII